MRQFRFSYDKAWMIRAVARYFVYREIISFFKRCYLFERERTSRGEGQREKQWTARREPDDNRQQCGTPSQDPGIMTWAEGRCFTDGAPQASLCTLYINGISYNMWPPDSCTRHNDFEIHPGVRCQWSISFSRLDNIPWYRPNTFCLTITW